MPGRSHLPSSPMAQGSHHPVGARDSPRRSPLPLGGARFWATKPLCWVRPGEMKPRDQPSPYPTASSLPPLMLTGLRQGSTHIHTPVCTHPCIPTYAHTHMHIQTWALQAWPWHLALYESCLVLSPEAHPGSSLPVLCILEQDTRPLQPLAPPLKIKVSVPCPPADSHQEARVYHRREGIRE